MQKKILVGGYSVEDLVKDPSTFGYMVYNANNMIKTVAVADSITKKEPPVVHVYTGLAHTGN